METVVYNGGAVKALGNGKVGGYLVSFGDSKHTDLEGDYFTPNTDFDLARSTKATVLYNHGLDKTLKGTKIGVGEMKLDDAGVWIEAQLELRNDYERAIYDMAQKGKLGWSSGTAAHLVERKKVGKSYEIEAWALGLDASLTPTPAEPRCLAMSLKSWQNEMKLYDPLEHIDQSLTSAVLNRLIDALYSACWQVVESEDTSIDERIALWTNSCAGISDKGAGLLKDFLAQPESAQEEMKSFLKARLSEMVPSTIRDFEKFLRDAGFSKSEALKIASHGFVGTKYFVPSSRRDSDVKDKTVSNTTYARVLETRLRTGVL